MELWTGPQDRSTDGHVSSHTQLCHTVHLCHGWSTQQLFGSPLAWFE